MKETGILKISRSESKDIDPVAVVFDIRVEGEKYLLGNAALEKSQVVRSLVLGLKELGATDEDIEVTGVTSKSSGGVFGSNTKAIYNIEIHLDDMKKIGAYFGLISSQGSTVGCEMNWIYDQSEVSTELSAKALVAAKKAAEEMAEAIGYRVVGIKKCMDGSSQDRGPYHQAAYPPQAAGIKASRVGYEVDLGTEIRATQKVTRWVLVDFYIAPGT